MLSADQWPLINLIADYMFSLYIHDIIVDRGNRMPPKAVVSCGCHNSPGNCGFVSLATIGLVAFPGN